MITEILGIAKPIADIIGSYLERSDRDALDKELHENIIKIQNAFTNNDLDEQYRIACQLLTDAGTPNTPGGDVATQEREFRHQFMCAVAQLIYERKMVTRAFAKLAK